MNLLTHFPVATVVALTIGGATLLAIMGAWIAMLLWPDRDEADYLAACLHQADELLAEAERRELAQLREIKRLRDVLRVYEAA